MKYFLFFANYLMGGISFGCLISGQWGIGSVFTLAYLFSYWTATKHDNETPQ